MENVQQPFGATLEDLQSKIGPQIDQARQNIADLDKRVSAFIRERPGTCLLGAIGIGFLIGRMASR